MYPYNQQFSKTSIVNTMHSLIQLLTVSSAPILTINTLPEEEVLPIGSNVTVTCTSNTSKDGISDPIYDMPYWMQIYFGHDSRLITIKSCGGRRSDREQSKVCSYVIHNASRSDSGNYTCFTRNSWKCTMGSIQLDFKGNIDLRCVEFYCI